MHALLCLALLADVPVEDAPADVPAEDPAPAPDADVAPAPSEDPPPAPPRPVGGPDAVTTTMIAGGAACLGMGLAFLAHVPFAVVLGALSVCPGVALPWGIYATCLMPFVVGEAGAYAAQLATKKVAHRRTANLVLLAGGAAVLGAGVGLYTLGSTLFTSLLGLVFVVVVSTPQLITVAQIVLVALGVAFIVLTVSSWIVTLIAAASAIGALAGYTGRRMFEGEPSEGTDWLRVRPFPDEEPVVEEELEEQEAEVVPSASRR